MEQKIKEVKPGGIGEELGLEPGDVLLAIDGQEIEDVLDYYFYVESDEIELLIRTKDGEECTCVVEKDEEEDLGLVFEEEFMGAYRHCHNKCMFCFIDQLPKGMRPTLYFKDDDARLSFLNGNYITMTNMSDEEFNKIIRYHMSPINISVHTTNPQLRVKMLTNPKAANIMERLQQLHEAGISMNAQIVLCKGVNDGEELDRTIRELGEMAPLMQSVAVVPVGLTCHREGLYPLEPYTGDDAALVIDQVEPYQKEFYEKYGLHFIHLSDEFYILAGRPVPEEETYDGYLQIENGVGMVRLFMNEAREALASHVGSAAKKEITVATAVSASGMIEEVCAAIQQKYPNLTIHVKTIINHFFGENITVTGLLTGKDLMEQLQGQPLGEKVLLPGNLIKDDEPTLLDDIKVSDIEKALQIPVDIVKLSGMEFVEKVTEGLH